MRRSDQTTMSMRTTGDGLIIPIYHANQRYILSLNSLNASVVDSVEHDFGDHQLNAQVEYIDSASMS